MGFEERNQSQVSYYVRVKDILGVKKTFTGFSFPINR